MNKLEKSQYYNKHLGLLNINTIFVTLAIVLLSYKVFWTHFANFINSTAPIFSNSFFVVFLSSYIVLFYLFSLKNYSNQLLLALGFSCVVLILILVNRNTNSENSNLIQMIRIYGYFWLILLALFFNIGSRIKESIMIRVLLLSTYGVSILGIVQHLLRSTIINPLFNGKSFVNSVYYWQGHSSSSVINQTGETIRGFGLTDSGLTLGLIALAAFCIVSYSLNSGKFKLICQLIALITIYCTLTRNVYLATLMSIIIMVVFGKKWNTKYLKILYCIELIAGILSIFGNTILGYLIAFFQQHGVLTFSSRYVYINFVLSEIKGWKSWLFGSNIVTHDGLPIDNGTVAVIADKGIIMFLLIQFMYLFILFKTIDLAKTDRFLKGLVTFALTYPLVSFANSVDVVYGYYFLIMLILYQTSIQFKNS